MNIRKEIRVGLFAIFSFFVLYWGFNYLKGKSIFHKTNTYYTLYNDADGLSTANQVKLNGCPVGRIQNIQLLPGQDYKVLVTLSVDKSIKLTNTTIARLHSSGLLDGKAIDLLIREGHELQAKDTLLSEIIPSLAARFTQEALPTLKDAKAISLLTTRFMQNLVENTDRINTIFHNLEQTSQQLHYMVKNNQADLRIISQNVAHISSALSDEETGIKPLLSSLSMLVQEVESFEIGPMSERINTILAKMESSTLNRVDRTLVDLNRLLIDIRRNPKRYVHFSIFGSNSSFRSASKVEDQRPIASSS
jgi:phospholipid/cholesterol/gamma-HCH transport system substrate-binding protein